MHPTGMHSSLCVGSHKVSVFSLRLGYSLKKFLFYLKILPFHEIFESTSSDDHHPTLLKEIVNIF